MIIRDYKAEDKEKCLAVFDSNCPKFFDVSERALFIRWLDHQAGQGTGYESPTYTDSEKDAYYVIELPDGNIAGCGGFYVVKEKREARLAWGMIQNDCHHKGYGTALYDHRRNIIRQHWPGHLITLGTSQHTFPFYEKMGMKVTAMIRAGYGPDLDRYDMEEQC